MFKDSLTIGKIWGIPIKLHFSFLLILPFLAWAFGNNIIALSEMAGFDLEIEGFRPYVLGLLLALLLFVSVGLHELAHSIVAKTKNVKILSINLMLFGGVAQMDELPEDPRDETMIAFAGPLLSLILGLFLVTVFSLGSAESQFILELQFVFVYLGYLNIFLAVFNLIPAFPTDGGRVLRSLIARRTSFVTATKIAAAIGKAFAFAFGIFGLLSGNFILIFIAFFIYIGASQEYQNTLLKHTLTDFKVKDLMTSDVVSVPLEMKLDDFIQKLFKERHSGYPVLEDGKLKGCITMEDVSKVKSSDYEQYSVGDIMSCKIIKVHPQDDIYQALKIMSREDVGRLMVMEDSRLIGIITRSDIMKGFRLRQLQENAL